MGNPGGHGGAISIHRTETGVLSGPHPHGEGKLAGLGSAVCPCAGLSLGLARRALTWNSPSRPLFQRPNKGVTLGEPEEYG